MNIIRSVNGIIHWCCEDVIVWSKRHRLYVSEDGGRSVSQVVSLAAGLIERLKSTCRLSQRLFRQGIVQAIELDDNLIAFADKRNLYHVRLRPLEIVRALPFPSHPPFRMGWDSKHLVYGEYFVNPTRLPVRIWASEDIGETWRPVHTFDDVRHVHSCQFDSFSDCFWVASGDLDHESHLRITSDLFSTICTVAGGDQRFRAIAFVFEKDHVLFGTDTPLARNCIMRMDRQTRSIQPILEVGGSVFYLDKCPQGLVCSTSVEPSTVNPSRQCEVWYSSDGNRWSRIAGFEKDNWSMHYFQFGRVHIPDGSGSTEGLWVSPIGTKGDGHSLLLGLPGQS